MREIPIVKANNLVEFCSNYRNEALGLVSSARRTFGVVSDMLGCLLLPAGDMIVKKWLIKSANPYLNEIKQIAKTLDISGVYALNLSYEWCCSSGAFHTDEYAPSMLRVLDWPFPGVGRSLFIVKQKSKAGIFYNITWPAISGIFQAMAPGRFAASINQAPMRQHGLTIVGDWLKNRKMFYDNSSLPPAHLLRQVFELAKNYEEAKKMLMETPISLPVIYTLTGINKGEGCIIERLENRAVAREIGADMGVSVSNHFQSELAQDGKGWLSRPIDSKRRAGQIACTEAIDLEKDNFAFLPYPVISHFTKLCMVANAKNGTMKIQGWEKDGPATLVTKLGY